MTDVTLTPTELFSVALAVTLGIGLIAVWRENTWHARVEKLRAEFGQELARRDREILMLNSRLDALVEFAGRAGIDFHAAGDVNLGGDAVGGGKR